MRLWKVHVMQVWNIDYNMQTLVNRSRGPAMIGLFMVSTPVAKLPLLKISSRMDVGGACAMVMVLHVCGYFQSGSGLSADIVGERESGQ